MQFLDTWQNRVPGVDFGGEIEAESGPLGGIIQTDNTLEAIWVWSHWTRITGETEYLDEIANAWTYAQQYPAWLEEGGDGYYRVHNCAWGLTAESEYRAATADTSKKAYARTCGDYVKNTPLAMPNTGRLNTFCEAWAAGNLFLASEELSRPDWRQKALDYGELIITWVNYNPPVQLSAEYWAMSSGTVVWGLCNTVFRNDPARGQTWIQNYGALRRHLSGLVQRRGRHLRLGQFLERRLLQRAFRHGRRVRRPALHRRRGRSSRASSSLTTRDT